MSAFAGAAHGSRRGGSEAGTNGSLEARTWASSDSPQPCRPKQTDAGAVIDKSQEPGAIAFPERGQLAAQISREIVQLHARLYGRGPTKARTYVERDYVLCVLEEVFTVAERTLIRAGNGEQVIATRMAFQEAIQGEFTELVEAAMKRHVRAFISQVHISAGLAVELFLLGSEAESGE